MKRIVITLPEFVADEARLIHEKFSGADPRFPGGLEILHLRKPRASVGEIESLIQEIEPQYYPRIVLHDAFELCLKYGLRGVHLNSRHAEAPEGVALVSRSCHSLEEVRRELAAGAPVAFAEKFRGESVCGSIAPAQKIPYAYVFLSPIFDSISKEGYGAAFTDAALRQAAADGLIGERTYALGGVDFSRLPYLESLGFGGAAMLGAAWRV